MTERLDDDLAELPAQYRAIARILRLGFRFEPKLLWISLGTTLVGALPDALVALWLGLIAKAFRTPGDPDRRLLVIAGCGLTVDEVRAQFAGLAARAGFADLPCARSGRIVAVDGLAYFSRPGPRLVDSLELLAHILHPALFPEAPAPFVTLGYPATPVPA